MDDQEFTNSKQIADDIARHFGIAIAKDDPILVLHYMNARLLEENHEAQQAILRNFSVEVTENLQAAVEKAKEVSTAINNAQILAAKTALSNAVEEANSRYSKDQTLNEQKIIDKLSDQIKQESNQLKIIICICFILLMGLILFVSL